MIQYIPFTQKMFSNNLSVNVTSLQSKRGEHEAGTVGHHYPMDNGVPPVSTAAMVCSHGGADRLTASFAVTVSQKWM